MGVEASNVDVHGADGLRFAPAWLPLCVSRAVAAQSEGSASDDVDGSPAMPQHNLRLSRKERENEAGHDDRIGDREVHFSSARGRGGGQSVLRQRLSRSRGAGDL